MYFIRLIAFCVVCLAFAEESTAPVERTVELFSQLKMAGKTIDYRTVAGTLVLQDESERPIASIFYTAYFSHPEQPDRPIAFCFNGGPGAGSVWLNVGFLGPKRLAREEEEFVTPPYSLVDNEDSLLDQMDLVFIDPMGSGLSQMAPGQSAQQMYGVEEDVRWMAAFVRLFTAKYLKWAAPKYLVGESYGGLRVAKMAYLLHNDWAYHINGLVFISPALDLYAIRGFPGNDLPYQLFLPSLTQAALYHKKIEGEALVQEAEAFAKESYARALFAGDGLSIEERQQVAAQLSRFTGLSVDRIQEADLRISAPLFHRELLPGKVVGRFDARFLGESSVGRYDPSLEARIGALTAVYNQYLRQELKWPLLREYIALGAIDHWQWGGSSLYTANALEQLHGLLEQNPKLKIFAASGIYDLATPWMAVNYSLQHIGISQQPPRWVHKLYKGGHMIYFNPLERAMLRRDLLEFLHKQ